VKQRCTGKRERFCESVDQALVCAPVPEPFESPASWLSRLSLTQAATVWEVLAHLKLELPGDVDIQFANCDLDRVARLCGLAVSNFAFMSHMFTQLQRIDAKGEVYLLSHDTFARYRFCEKCLKEQSTPHFPLHWRFKAWRWCPLHSCLLSDHCPRCKSIVLLPMSLVSAGRRRSGVAYLNSCLVCGAKLAGKPKSTRFANTRNNLTPAEHLLLSNGRALLAALYHDGFRLSSNPQRYSLESLLHLESRGHLPHGIMHFETSDVMKDPRYRHPLSNKIRGPSTTGKRQRRRREINAGGIFN
jgi:TniQ